MQDRIKLPPCWKEHLKDEFSKDYMKSLKKFLSNEINSNKIIYPKMDDLFSAFFETTFDNVKVVILGQDPYHGPNQAHGLAFSVRHGIKTPPSLVNIFKELSADQKISPPNHGNLSDWCKQGVLLLNSVLTVEDGKAASHQGHGWEQFTDKVIEILNQKKSNLVFMLWGAPAQKKGANIDPQKHLILKAPHPSPLSAHRGFLGCRHFSQANKYLVDHKIRPINWKIT